MAATTARVLIYSSDSNTRNSVRMAVGTRAAADLPEIEWTECATVPPVLEAADSYAADLLILDGEATPAGGLGVCKQLKDEIYNCPPILVLTARVQDAWLATWSNADAVVSAPIDPLALSATVAEQLRAALQPS